jgi:hypothetical protein
VYFLRKNVLEMPGIGLLNEKPLHAALKDWYSKPGDRFEVPVDGFVIDIVRNDLLLEIQTGGFASIKLKLLRLLNRYRVRLIYPIAQEKWVVKLAKDRAGNETCRKSPKRGRIEDVFLQMVSFPYYLSNPNFALDVLLIKEKEVRRFDGKLGWRRKGWVIEERQLIEIVDQKLFQKPADWEALLPKSLDQKFTTRDLMKSKNITLSLAQRMAYCLRKAGVIELIGKQGRAYSYRVAVDKRELTG